jgi:hypothetical protein
MKRKLNQTNIVMDTNDFIGLIRLCDNDSISFDKKKDCINSIESNILEKVLATIYTDPAYFTKIQRTLDKLRNCKSLNLAQKNTIKSFPFLLFISDIITSIDIMIIKNFMKKSKDIFCPTDSDNNRQYYFSESYQTYFLNEKLYTKSIYQKGKGSPTKEIDNIIQRITDQFYTTLKTHCNNFNKNDCKQYQLNVFLAQNKTKDNTNSFKPESNAHVAWHRDCDGKNIPDYSMVILLDEPTWIGGNLLCQYTGINLNRKKTFKTPIVTFTPQYKGGIILRNYDTQHMVDEIKPIPKPNNDNSFVRSVLVLQLYKHMYAYDKI